MSKSIKLVLGAFCIAAVLSIVGCASIIHGTRQNITVTTLPTKANVSIKTIGGIEVFNGTTPVLTKISRNNEYDVFVTLEGYKVTKVHISKNFDALFLGNLLCGGVVGMIIDGVNGAMWKLEPNAININLVTASINNSTATYAVFSKLDDQGNLKRVIVPLIKA
jgi:hypothetical protein